MNYFIKNTEEFGRGIYAAYDLEANKILFTAELLVFGAADTIKVNETDLKWYTFKYNETQDCLVLGDGEIFNHSDTPNAKYKLIDFDGRKVMAFYLTKAIQQGDQIFIDYGDDVKVDATQYTTNMIGG